MTNKKIIEILKNNDFIIHDLGNDELEIETWTNGNVNMIFSIHNKNNIEDEFSTIVEYFDIDNEIEVNRENKEYRANFSCRDSVEDFEEFKEKLEKIKKEIEKEVNINNELKEMKEFLFENDIDNFNVDFRKNKDIIEGIDILLSGPFAEKLFTLSIDEFLVAMKEIYNRCE